MSAQPHDDQFDGPFCAGGIQWRRTGGEVRAECARLNEKTAELMARNPALYNEADRMLGGILAAAAWSAGEVTLAPMNRGDTALDGAGLVQQVELAQAVSADHEHPNSAYALGVSAWLGWMMGAIDHVMYPDES